MFKAVSARRAGAVGAGFVAAALAVEFVDELVDGVRGAALPLIRHDLGLSYAQVGLLLSVPLLAGGLIELPVGIVAGYGLRRRRAVCVGGVVFVASVAAAAGARTFPVLLASFVAFFPAAGAFVGLTQAELMDAEPARRPERMAAWTVAGSIGYLAGPAAVLGVLATGRSWRVAFVAAAAAGAAGLALLHRALGARHRSTGVSPQRRPSLQEVTAVLRRGGVWRWLALLQVSDLLLDVLTGFVALYVVDVAHASPAWGAGAVALRRGAGLAGEAALVPLLRRLSARALLRRGTVLAAVAYPGFVLLPGLGPKLAALAVASLGTAAWYPILQAELYAALDGHSAVAVTLDSAAGLAGGFGPLVVGLAAQHLGLRPALTALAVVPVAVLSGLPRRHASPDSLRKETP